MLKRQGFFHKEGHSELSESDIIGQNFEKKVFETFEEFFSDQNGEAYLNQPFYGKRADMVVPVIDRHGQESLLLIECKHISSGMGFDGKTKHGDPVEQVLGYVDCAQRRLKETNQEIKIYPIVVVSDS